MIMQPFLAFITPPRRHYIIPGAFCWQHVCLLPRQKRDICSADAFSWTKIIQLFVVLRRKEGKKGRGKLALKLMASFKNVSNFELVCVSVTCGHFLEGFSLKGVPCLVKRWKSVHCVEFFFHFFFSFFFHFFFIFWVKNSLPNFFSCIFIEGFHFLLQKIHTKNGIGFRRQSSERLAMIDRSLMDSKVFHCLSCSNWTASKKRIPGGGGEKSFLWWLMAAFAVTLFLIEKKTLRDKNPTMFTRSSLGREFRRETLLDRVSCLYWFSFTVKKKKTFFMLLKTHFKKSLLKCVKLCSYYSPAFLFTYTRTRFKVCAPRFCFKACAL